MKLTTLGAWGQSYAGPTTSFYLEVGSLGVMLDTGIDPIGQMRAHALKPADCTHLFLSHMHSDHSSGFANFVFTRQLLGRSLDPAPPPLTVIGSEQVIEDCQRLLGIQYPDRSFKLEWLAIDGGSPLALGNDLMIATAPNIHSIPCQGCRIETPSGAVGFTADTAPSEAHISFYSGCAVLVGEAFGTEAQVGPRVNERGHSSAEDLGHLVDRARPRMVVPFHFGIECQDAQERRSLLEAAAGGGSADIIDPVTTPSLSIA